MVSLGKLIGLAGVSKKENHSARTWGKRFDLAMVLVAIWLPLQWHLQNQHMILPDAAQFANWIIWIFFVCETAVLTSLVENKFIYTTSNWLKLGIIIFGCPWFWELTPLIGAIRILQLLVMLRLLLPWWNTSVLFLAHNRLGTTLITAFVTTTLAGVLMSVIDPNFNSPWRGIWWAWETVTTVGYGDSIPSSFVGRVLAVFMMLMGIALISILTANFSAYFVNKDTSQVVKTEDKILSLLKKIDERLDKIEEKVKKK